MLIRKGAPEKEMFLWVDVDLPCQTPLKAIISTHLMGEVW